MQAHASCFYDMVLTQCCLQLSPSSHPAHNCTQPPPRVYSSEVAVIVAATLAVGALGASRSSFRAGWALPALALYPLSLGGVYLLDALLGWQ